MGEVLMDQEINVKELDEKIQTLKSEAEALRDLTGDFPALYRNTRRILASIKMLEMNLSDVLDLL
jgi:hypothetical protein